MEPSPNDIHIQPIKIKVTENNIGRIKNIFGVGRELNTCIYAIDENNCMWIFYHKLNKYAHCYEANLQICMNISNPVKFYKGRKCLMWFLDKEGNLWKKDIHKEIEINEI